MKLRRARLSIRVRLTLWYIGVLLSILVAMSALSYSVLRWSLRRDLDASLLVVAQVIRDTEGVGRGAPGEPAVETLLREMLGPEFYEKFFQVRNAEGGAMLQSAYLPAQGLPLSPVARANAARGVETFETVTVSGRGRIRLLTMPVLHDGRVSQIVQAGISLRRTEQALDRYIDTLLILVPVGVGLAAAGGTAIARRALRPVDVMARTARRISGEDISQRVPSWGTGDELDHLAETLNAMLERLEAAFGEIRRFAANAAHELRTPLTALKGGIEVALRAERSTEEYQRVLTSSLEEVERLIRLAEDLLLLSRTSAGLDRRRAPVELEPFLLEVLDRGARLARGRGVTVRAKDMAPVTVAGDAEALRRAVLNLVENAVKYTPAGGTVELSLAHEARCAALVVQDTGVGIEPAHTERVFEPFVRLESARQLDPGGSGLGLAIARSVVLAHGGTISVDSIPGSGSRFTIRLPLL